MTEDQARAWLGAQGVSRETMLAIERFIAFLFEAGDSQNLIAASTRDQVWARHIVDSAQLVPLAHSAGAGPWLDLGSGAGFPGLIVATLTDRPVVLVESRPRRAAFLAEAAQRLGVTVRIEAARLERIALFPAAVISARAFAPLDRLFGLAVGFSRPDTLWLLPKGRKAQSELDEARKTWQGAFHVEHSVTDEDSAIIVSRGVRRGKT